MLRPTIVRSAVRPWNPGTFAVCSHLPHLSFRQVIVAGTALLPLVRLVPVLVSQLRQCRHSEDGLALSTYELKSVWHRNGPSSRLTIKL